MILQRQGKKSVYSDGAAIEKRILEIATRYPEDASEDYIAQDSTYTINNTFSSVRKNILNWYPFKDNATILEIGAGMGALTGLLCDHARHVTALEMNEQRAAVIHARYGGRTNLEILTADINSWETNEIYDYIVVVGVLEYAAVFSDEDDAFDLFLSKLSSFLADDGKMLLAIENRFGLKYWTGASEDHLQKPFIGISGYQGGKTPKTFTKNELEQLIRRNGFDYLRFYYVLPDYKFPEIIYTDEYTPDYAALQKVNFTHTNNSMLVCDERVLYKDIIENRIHTVFANSFLVEASKSSLEELHPVYVSCKGEVKKEYRVNTVICSDGTVLKSAAHKSALGHLERIKANTIYLSGRGIQIIDGVLQDEIITYTLHKGQSAHEYFSLLLSEGNLTELKTLFLLLKENLCKSSDSHQDKATGETILNKGFIDMTFYNAFYEQGELVFYDQEWCFKNLPLRFILYYAIKSSFVRAESRAKTTLDDLLNLAEIPLGLKDDYDKLESEIWGRVLYRTTDFYGEDGYCNRFRVEDTLNAVIDSTRKECVEIRESLSKEHARASRIQGELDEKIYHVEILMEELDRIKARKIYRAMDIVSRGIHKVISFPGRAHRLLSSVTPRRIRRVANYVKNEGLADGYRHAIHDYHRGMDNVKPKVDSKIDQEIRDLSACERLIFPTRETPRVSIVIPVYNQFTYTYHCLKSILEQSGDVAYEVIVTDDCSDDLTTRLDEIVENIHIVRNRENLLFLRNCNNAAKHARGEFILFLNNDTQVQEDWLAPLVALMDRDPQIGLTGSKLLYPDGTLQEAGGIIWRDGSGWNYGRGGNAIASEYDYVRDVDYISGAAIMIRRSLWEEIGGFDDRFAPAYYEDTDLAFQVRQKGYRVVFQPASAVVHFEGKSNGTDLNAGIKKHQVENAAKFYEKWRTVLETEQFDKGQDMFLARNRSGKKKRIFVTDHYIPRYDNDAGGKCTYMYLLQFIHMGMHVTFLGENCARTEPYYSALTQAGIETLVGDYYYQHWEDWLKENGHYFDYVYMQRPHITLKYLDAVKKYCPGKLFYFDHDLHHVRKQREYEITGDPEYLKSAEEWKEKEFHIIESVDVVHVVGSFEEEYLKNIFPEKTVRNIPLYIYEQVPADIPKDFGKRQDILFVGGFGHPPNGDAVLWFAQEIYPKVLERYPDMVWHIVGSHPTKEIQKLAGRNIRIEGFLSDQELEHLYRTCRLAVVPLRYGAGVKGKIVEAAYYGLPVITTPIGAEGISLEEGFLTVRDTAGEIAQAVIELYDDTDRLKELSDAGGRLIDIHYSEGEVSRVLSSDMQGFDT